MIRKKKFIFTQISAPIIGLGSCFLATIFLRKYFPIKTFTLMTTVLGIVGYGVLLIGSMWLWGRVLVLFGILTKEEAQGYPFSKPWEEQ
ncbi:hypothetical protein ACFL38_00940 [Candidatus Omnitrophota bacterium]